MMKLVLAIHISGGATALLSMAIPMLSRKGGIAHRRAGWVFVVGMAIVSVTSLMLGAERFVTNPWPGARVSAMFLSYLGVLTGGLVSAGVRVLRFKERTGSHRGSWDLALAGFVVVAGLAMGIYGWAAKDQPLLVAFAAVGLFSGGSQLSYWLRSPGHRMHWWFARMNMMLGAAVSAVTGFVVNNVGRVGLDDTVLVWIAPTLVGIPLGIGWTRYYVRRFSRITATSAASRPAVVAATIVFLAVSGGRFSAQSLSIDGREASFEVASIKTTTRMLAPAPHVLPGGQFEMSGITLRDLIRVAYPTRQGQVDVVGGPDWVRNTRFEVIAKPPAGTRPTTFMLQALLSERFKLKMHMETRQGPIWSLTLANKQGTLGPDLTPSTCGRAPERPAAKANEESFEALTASPTSCTSLRIGAGPSMVGDAAIGDLASILSNFPVINAPVVDRTGLTGGFNIRLRWRADNNPNPDAGPLVFTALEEQLGLKLERGTGLVDVLVIDAVQPASEN